jgi:hypothetical protein
MLSGHVGLTSVEELEAFELAMVKFVDEAGDALLAVDLVLRRFVDWLRNEQPLRLHQAHLASMERIAEARSALQRKRLARVGDRPPDTTEEEEALRQAIRRRETIEQQIEMTKRWGRLIEQPLSEYRSQSQQLSAMIEGNPPACVAFLQHACRSAREYLAVEAPTSVDDVATPSMARRPIDPSRVDDAVRPILPTEPARSPEADDDLS